MKHIITIIAIIATVAILNVSGTAYAEEALIKKKIEYLVGMKHETQRQIDYFEDLVENSKEMHQQLIGAIQVMKDYRRELKGGKGKKKKKSKWGKDSNTS